MKAGGLLVTILLAAGTAGAQEYLSCQFAPGWVQAGAKRQYGADNLFEYKDGAAEGYLSFGFVRMVGISCKRGRDTLDIDVSEMKDPDAAYGMYAVNSDPTAPAAKLGMGGQVQWQSASFAKGVYYVEIVETAADTDANDTATMQAFATAMEKRLDGRVTPPEALGWFPKEDLETVRVVPQSVLGLSELKRGYVAKYKAGQAFIVPEASPEAAAASLASVRKQFDDAAPAQVGDESFTAKVKYLEGICFFRKGRYVGGYANMSDPQEAAAQAKQLAAAIP
ncbi:MAG: DUF6599 family protein [Acidobacteriota bacterium]